MNNLERENEEMRSNTLLFCRSDLRKRMRLDFRGGLRGGRGGALKQAIYTDEKIKLTIDKRILDKEINVFDYATFCYNGDVYLIGEYETAEQKEKVSKIAHSVRE